MITTKKLKTSIKIFTSIILISLLSCHQEKFTDIKEGDYVFAVGSEYRGGALSSTNYYEVFKISQIKGDWVILVPLRFYAVQDEYKYDFYKMYEKLSPEQKFRYLETHFDEISIQTLTYKDKYLIDSHAYVSGDMDFIPDLHIDKYPKFKQSPFAVVDYTQEEKDTLKSIEKEVNLPIRKAFDFSKIETKFTKLSELKTGKAYFYIFRQKYVDGKYLPEPQNKKYITKVAKK